MTYADSNNKTTNCFTYVPPLLPDYLPKAYTLKTIIGVPKDEEVKGIHDVIRALDGLSTTVPTLYDAKLSTQLAQHLFAVQMAVYRSEYPSSIFPSDNVYPPPTMPPHIPISLELVVGSPSDEELASVFKAARAIQHLSNSPLFQFDSVLGVRLSQHLFNIQFARYIHDLNQGNFVPGSVEVSPSKSETVSSIVTLDPTSNISELRESQKPQREEPKDLNRIVPDHDEASISRSLPSDVLSEPVPISKLNLTLDRLRIAQEETNQLLCGNAEVLKDIRRTLVTTQSLAHPSYNKMNNQGELPWMYNPPCVKCRDPSSLFENLNPQHLASYLEFYGIGTDLLEDGSGDLKEGRELDAIKTLACHLYY
ncbi:unnamed protein product [Rhizoctonia solani]|uniref:Uncharacterized protein n=1 Tax=Rhizoctonia solani TaxID=456999 RepID=A0A8H2WDV6_9AGAM|nr:unnamed protein product [Rhizoctonia solani]